MSDLGHIRGVKVKFRFGSNRSPLSAFRTKPNYFVPGKITIGLKIKIFTLKKREKNNFSNSTAPSLLKKKIKFKKNCDGKSKRNKIRVTLWWTCGQIGIITYKNEHWLY